MSAFPETQNKDEGNLNNPTTATIDSLSWPEVEWIHPETSLEQPIPDASYQSLKPAMDFCLACLIAVPAFPVVLMCWLLVRMTSRGPGFYSQVRSGLHGQPYRIWKLRTMAHNIEAKTGIQWSSKGDARVTKFGKILRATHLDELPQLINVLRGEMSLVGPRPERPEVIHAKGLARLVPGYEYRLNVRPGVTGFAQLQLPPDSDISSVRHKVAYDLYYIKHQSLWFDLRLIVATAMKTTGLKPTMLRKLFLLPSRERVGEYFRCLASKNVEIAPQESSTDLRMV